MARGEKGMKDGEKELESEDECRMGRLCPGRHALANLWMQEAVKDGEINYG